MSRRFVLTPVVVVAAISAAACGSSSTKSTTGTAAVKPASTPAVPQTPSTGTSTSLMPSNVMGTSGSSVPLNSPALKTALAARFAKDKRIPAKDDGPLADCLLKKLQAKGYKTVGDAEKHVDVIKSEAVACAAQLPS